MSRLRGADRDARGEQLAGILGAVDPIRAGTAAVTYERHGAGLRNVMSNAQVTLVEGDLRGILRDHHLSAAAVRNMRQHNGALHTPTIRNLDGSGCLACNKISTAGLCADS